MTANNTRKIKRIQTQLQEKSDECLNLVSKIAEIKLAEGEDGIKVKDWNREEEEKLQPCDDMMDNLDEYIKDQKKKEEQESTQREYKLEEDRRQRRIKGRR